MSRSFEYGEMKATNTMTPAKLKSLATSEMRRMFSARSSAEKERPLLRPVRITSPSRIKTLVLSPVIESSFALRASERVDLPAPDRPVNQ